MNRNISPTDSVTGTFQHLYTRTGWLYLLAAPLGHLTRSQDNCLTGFLTGTFQLPCKQTGLYCALATLSDHVTVQGQVGRDNCQKDRTMASYSLYRFPSSLLPLFSTS